MINDTWTETKAVNLSECWTGTTRIQILRTRLLEGYKWVTWRPTKFKTTRLDSILPGAWTQLPKKQKEQQMQEWREEHTKLQAVPASGKFARCRLDNKDFLKVNADARSNLEKEFCSCYAECLDGGRSR